MMNSLTGLDNSLETELELMLRQRHSRAVVDRERDLHMFRSGSAPPTVEGSLSAVGSLFRNSDFVQFDGDGVGVNGVLTEEELRSHPAYVSYYYSHGNFNPRLPPPLLSKEDWRVAQRFQAGGSSLEGNRDWLKKSVIDESGSSSLFSMQPGLATQTSAEAELMELRKAVAAENLSRTNSSEWMDRADGLIGVSGAGMGGRKKSFADILQEGLEQPASSSGRISRVASRNAIDIMDVRGISNSHSIHLCNGKETSEALHPRVASTDLSSLPNLNSAVPHSFASAVGSSLSRNRTPEHQPIRRTPSPGIPPSGSRVLPAEKQSTVGSVTELADVAASLSCLSLSKNHLPDRDSHLPSQIQMEFGEQSNYLVDMSNGQRIGLQQQLINHSRKDKLGIDTKYVARENANVADLKVRKSGFDGQMNFHRRAASSVDYSYNPNMYEFTKSEGPNLQNRVDNYSRMDFTCQRPGRFSVQTLKTAVNDNLPTASTLNTAGNGHVLRQRNNQAVSSLHLPVMDSQFTEYMLKSSDYAAHAAASSGDLSQGRNNYGISQGHEDLQKVYLKALLAQQNQQYDSPLFGRSGSLNHLHYGNPTYGHGMPYQGNVMENSRPLSHSERTMRLTSTLRNSVGGSTGSWSAETGINLDGRYASSLLDELKNNKTKSFELSDVVGHVIEFSTDQYGSRFIQQKLETATVEEKEMIFPEIIPHARSLMTDVFGNYVIQKFFEYGTESQRKELASQLIGHVLPLSLQMYGCRVIQKALEVIDLKQQTQLVAELDGSIIKCVRDQNGNHVIQKCIECVPQDQIQFVVSSFFGQVVSLSSHPYGCRVIQRVLEHCDDPNTQKVVMDEIMNSICTLAQDQYGNYVIQHVLQHGKPHERSAVISKLAGQIVKMSQQKFASNVVEKCLTFGGPEERQLLVNEMLGTTEENEPLQAMMKDPFGNYVVQKVLETCDDRSRELILSRIKVHLAALKRYTYGKHIVSRVEKLITSGERHAASS